jgi:hypothetical protein
LKYLVLPILALLVIACSSALRENDVTVGIIDSAIRGAHSSESSTSTLTPKNSLVVFIGEKIEVRHIPQERHESVVDTIISGSDTVYKYQGSFIMDNCYAAKYKILQLVNGTFIEDTIDFLAYDHFGEPAFSKFETVLLFVSEHDGIMYHEKYQYFDLYKTVDGSWASPYSTGDYRHPYRDSITVKPEIITFRDDISFPLGNLTAEEIKIWYPEPFYKIHEGRATAIYGNYVEDLFKLKQQTILRARGIY